MKGSINPCAVLGADSCEKGMRMRAHIRIPFSPESAPSTVRGFLCSPTLGSNILKQLQPEETPAWQQFLGGTAFRYVCTSSSRHVTPKLKSTTLVLAAAVTP